MMHKIFFAVTLLLANFSSAEEAQNGTLEYMPITGDYAIYGGGLGDGVVC